MDPACFFIKWILAKHSLTRTGAVGQQDGWCLWQRDWFCLAIINDRRCANNSLRSEWRPIADSVVDKDNEGWLIVIQWWDVVGAVVSVCWPVFAVRTYQVVKLSSLQLIPCSIGEISNNIRPVRINYLVYRLHHFATWTPNERGDDHVW